MVYSPGFNFEFLSSSQEIGQEDRLRYDLLNVEWDVKPKLSIQKSGLRKASDSRQKRQ